MIPLSTYEAAEKRLHALGDGARPTTAEAKAVRVLAQGPKRKPSKKQRRDRLGPATLHHEAVRADDEKTERQREREVYADVRERDRICTALEPELGPCFGRLTVDHQWGRGKEPTLRENCRVLCVGHHRRKTDGVPSRIAWLGSYRRHSFNLEHFAEVEKTDRVIALEKVQHPAASRSGAEGERDPKEKGR